MLLRADRAYLYDGFVKIEVAFNKASEEIVDEKAADTLANVNDMLGAVNNATDQG